MALAITSTALTAKAGAGQMFPLVATGATGAVTWERADVETLLPPGMQLAGSALSGTPQGSGTFAFRVRASDQSTPFPQFAIATVTLTINP